MCGVSVITPVYVPESRRARSDDLETYARRTEASLANQTNRDFEWILVDDGSSWMPEVWKTIPAKVVRIARNYGPSVARNMAFQVADGDIVAYLDLGDEYSKGKIDHVIEQFRVRDLDFLLDGHTLTDSLGRRAFYNPRKWFDSLNRSTPEAPPGVILRRALQRSNVGIPMDVAHSRKPFVLAGGFQRGIVRGSDGILWRRMMHFIEPHKVWVTGFDSGLYYVEPDSQARTQRRFEMGGFAFQKDHPQGPHGQYLDKYWFEVFNSKGLYDGDPRQLDDAAENDGEAER